MVLTILECGHYTVDGIATTDLLFQNKMHGGYMTRTSNKYPFGPEVLFGGACIVWKMNGGWHRYYGPAVIDTDSWWLHNQKVKHGETKKA